MYLLSRIDSSDNYKNKFKIENIFNKVCVVERYKQCDNLFNKLKECNIPFAVIKGAVLSDAAYKNPYIRNSGDLG